MIARISSLLGLVFFAACASSSDPTCAAGIIYSPKQICCPKSCGKCGGTGCQKFPGGADNCCVGVISKSGRACSNNDAPCIIHPATPSAGNCSFCDVEFTRVGGTPLSLDIYLPSGANNMAPVPGVIFIHGGGWSSGNKNHGIDYTLGLVPYGIAVVSIEYRLTTQGGKFGNESVHFPAQLNDSLSALAWLRDNGIKYAVNGNVLGVWGESAGGHLSAILSTYGAKQGPSSKLLFSIDMFGPTDMLQAYDGGSADRLFGFDVSEVVAHRNDTSAPWPDRVKAVEAANPITYLDKDAPPMFIGHGTKDTTVPILESELMAKALNETRVPYVFERIEGGGHTYSHWPYSYIQEAIDFAVEHLKQSTHAAPQTAMLI